MLVVFASFFFTTSCVQNDVEPSDSWVIFVEGDFGASICTRYNHVNVNFAEVSSYVGFETDITIPSYVRGVPVEWIGYSAFFGMELTSVVIPDSIIRIDKWAFAFNRLTHVDIPDSVMEIGERAFAANELNSVTIPAGITQINRELFANNNFSEFTIPENIVHIYANAFLNNNLTEIYIPDSVRIIEGGAFLGNDIKKITIGEDLEHTLWGNPSRAAFPHGFDDFYRENGRRAGTYTFDDTQWHAEFR
jgi:hypothetical protein